MASAFAFESGEPVDAEARRLAKEGAARVLVALERAESRTDERERLIHDARRSLKRLRALVRLVSGDRALGHLLRDAARRLAGARDAAVVVRTFDGIAGDDPGDARVRAVLARARRQAEKLTGNTAAANVREFAAAVDDWKLRDGWKALEPGLRRSYRDGRRALRRASEHAEPEALHTLRKRCKDLQHELALLRDVWPPVVKGYGDATRELGELLGDDHDLVVLREELVRRVADPDRFLARIDKRRRELRELIFPLAARIYCDSTSVFVGRFAKWWAAAGRSAHDTSVA